MTRPAPTSIPSETGSKQSGTTERLERGRLHSSALRLAVGAGVLAGLFVWYYYAHYAPGLWSDFDQLWLGSRAILNGEDPYVAVPKAFPWPLYYPVPALILGIPFAPWPLPVARALFGAVTAFACVAAVLRFRPWAASLVLSAPFIYAIQRGQWTPLLVAAALVPAMGAALVAKPSIGLAVFAYRPTRGAVIGGILLGTIALALLPSWPWTWLRTAVDARHMVPPVALPLGFLLLACLFRWRRPESRLLAVLACVPQTAGLYELFPLALIPRTRIEALTLTLSFNVLYVLTIGTRWSAPIVPADVPEHYYPVFWPLTLLLGYLPALIMVLRRPNTALPDESPTPERLSRPSPGLPILGQIFWGMVLLGGILVALNLVLADWSRP